MQKIQKQFIFVHKYTFTLFEIDRTEVPHKYHGNPHYRGKIQGNNGSTKIKQQQQLDESNRI